MSGYIDVWKLLDSKIWTLHNHVRILSVTMALIAEDDGMVDNSIDVLASLSNLSIGDASDAVRSLVEHGFLVEAIGGGWRVNGVEDGKWRPV